MITAKWSKEWRDQARLQQVNERKAAEATAELEARLDQRWQELGLADVGQSDPDPALFGYALEQVLQRLATTPRG